MGLMGKHSTRPAVPLKAAVAAAGLSLCLAACETVFVQPAASPTTARVDYQRDPELGRFGTGEMVSWVNGPDCAEVLRIAAYDPMTIGSKSFRLTGGEPVHILAEIFPVGAGGLNTNIQCVNLISFTPEAGRSYTLLQTFRDGKCQTTVTEQASATPVSTLVEHPLTPACVRTPAGYIRAG
jgi:hypothetical protein